MVGDQITDENRKIITGQPQKRYFNVQVEPLYSDCKVGDFVFPPFLPGVLCPLDIQFLAFALFGLLVEWREQAEVDVHGLKILCRGAQML